VGIGAHPLVKFAPNLPQSRLALAPVLLHSCCCPHSELTLRPGLRPAVRRRGSNMAESGSVHSLQRAGTPARELVAHASASGSRRTITRSDLAEAVYRRIGLSRKESALLVEAVLDELANTLAAGEAVKLSSFGRFSIRSKSERIGRNPKTGVEVPITERRVLVFKPSNVLRARMNGFEADEVDAEDGNV